MNTTPSTTGTPVVSITDVHKSYGAKQVLSGVSLTVRRGEVLGVAGPNGAGKTTLVECVTGLREPDSGTIEVLGRNPRTKRRTLLEDVGVQLQESSMPGELRVGEALRLYSGFYRKPADWQAVMERWGLTDKARTSISDLSGGWKQRLQIALAVVGDPELVILDELTTGLDPYARRATWDLVREMRDAGVTILLVSHFMDEAEYLCDRMAVLGGGRVLATGTPAGITAETGQDTLDDAFVQLIGATQ